MKKDEGTRRPSAVLAPEGKNGLLGPAPSSYIDKGTILEFFTCSEERWKYRYQTPPAITAAASATVILAARTCSRRANSTAAAISDRAICTISTGRCSCVLPITVSRTPEAAAVSSHTSRGWIRDSITASTPARAPRARCSRRLATLKAVAAGNAHSSALLISRAATQTTQDGARYRFTVLPCLRPSAAYHDSGCRTCACGCMSASNYGWIRQAWELIERCWRERANQTQRRAREVLADVLPVYRIIREMLGARIRIRTHGMKREGQDALAESGVWIGVLGPAIHQQEEIPRPSGGQ